MTCPPGCPLGKFLAQLLLACNRHNMYMTLRNDTACAAFCGRSPRYRTMAEQWMNQRLWIQISVPSHLRLVSAIFITRLQLSGTSYETRLWEKNPLPHQGIKPTSLAFQSDTQPSELPPPKDTRGQSTYRSLFSLHFLLFHEQTQAVIQAQLWLVL